MLPQKTKKALFLKNKIRKRILARPRAEIGNASSAVQLKEKKQR